MNDTSVLYIGMQFNLFNNGISYGIILITCILKSQVVYSKQPKLGLTQEFVVDCAHALWVVHSIKRLVSLMLLKWFLSDSFIYFMYRMFNENF